MSQICLKEIRRNYTRRREMRQPEPHCRLAGLIISADVWLLFSHFCTSARGAQREQSSLQNFDEAIGFIANNYDVYRMTDLSLINFASSPLPVTNLILDHWYPS
jgi:hypothetical protein